MPYLSIAALTAMAATGAVLAVVALYSGIGRIGTKFTLLGVWAALVLVLMPVLLRALAAPLSFNATLRAYFLWNIVPAVLFGVLAAYFWYAL